MFDRTELIITGVMDAVFIACMVVARGLLLQVFDVFLPSERSDTILLRVLEIVLDFGLIGTAIVVTVFDLAKRIKNAIAEFRHPVG